MSSVFSRTKEESAEYCYLEQHVSLADISDADVLTDFPLDFWGEVVSLRVIVSTPVTTGSKASTLTVEINSTAVEGISLGLTSANMTPLGAVLNDDATGAKAFGPDDTISIVASSTTAFVEGSATLCLVLKRQA